MRALAIALLASLALAAVAHAQGPDRRPNIVVIETDDQTVSDLASMPYTRRLIERQGLSFSQSVVSLSECCPSRATFLTGRYAHNHHVISTEAPFGGYTAFDPQQSLAVWLQRAGYSTALVGKYFNGYGKGGSPTPVPPGWTEWHGLYGPDLYSYIGFKLVNDHRPPRGYPGWYETNKLTQVAQSVLRRRARASRPLFMWLTYVAPHVGVPEWTLLPRPVVSASPAPIFDSLFLGLRLPKPPSFNEADVSDKPLTVRRRPLIGGFGLGQVRSAWHRRLQSLATVDEGVLRIVRQLHQMGALKHTLLVFTSDNGFMTGQHRLAHGKVWAYEPSIRVPLLMRGPGVPRGSVSPQLVWNGDLAPTILQAAGAHPAWEPDGVSLWPYIQDPSLHRSRTVVIEGPPIQRLSSQLRFTGLRTDHYTYLEHAATGEVELYDLQRDPYELDNLANRPADQALRARFARELAGLRRCAGAPCHVFGPPTGLPVSPVG